MEICCKIDGCDRTKLTAHGLCDMHYRQAKRAENPIRPADLPGERWAPFEGLDRVLVSTLGRVKSLRSPNNHLICKPKWYRRKPGHQAVLVANVNPLPLAPVHMAILKAFRPNPDNVPRGVFVDGNSENCTLSNLHWADRDYYLPQALVIAKQTDNASAKALLQFWDGDQSAIDQIISTQYRVLPNYVQRRIDTYRLPYYLDAEDITQEAVIAGVDSIKRGMINPSQNINGWWAGVAKRQTYNAIRRHPKDELSADFAPHQLLAGCYTNTRYAL